MTAGAGSGQSGRYARQLPLWGLTGQQRLAAARVLVAGAGGLGSVVVPYLAASGVGTIGIVDDDVVELSNLHRQVMHGVETLGEPKVASAALAAARLNPETRIVRFYETLDAASAAALVSGPTPSAASSSASTGWDLVVDCLDRFEARFALSDAAAAGDVPVVWGAVLGYDGQVSVFDGGLTLRSLYPSVPSEADAANCATVGVLGPACAVIGGLMAAEALKLLTGFGEPLTGRVAIYDALDASWREVPLRSGGLAVVAPPPSPEPSAVPVRIDLRTLKADLAEGSFDGVLIDLREDDEVAVAPSIAGSIRLPFNDFVRGARPDESLRAEELVLYCAHGIRSDYAAQALAAEGWHVAQIEGGLEHFLAV